HPSHDPAGNHPPVCDLEHPTRGRLMKEFKRSGSSYYAYKFQYRGREYYRSTGTENRREAESIAAAARARVIRQAAGLEEPEPLPQALPVEKARKPVPTLAE